MKKWVLSRRDSAEAIGSIESKLSVDLRLAKSAQASCEEPEEGVVFMHFDSLAFVKDGEMFIPFLGSQDTLALFPAVTVDEGAIKYMLNGADVMRPGITDLGDWGPAGRTVVIREQKKGRAIAIGVASVSGGEAKEMTKGPCLKNVHHVGDRYWTLYKTL